MDLDKVIKEINNLAISEYKDYYNLKTKYGTYRILHF